MSDAKLVQIYMPLRPGDDGARGVAPVYAYPLGGDVYRVLGRQPGHEHWRWPPDAIVSCAMAKTPDGLKPTVVGGRQHEHRT